MSIISLATRTQKNAIQVDDRLIEWARASDTLWVGKIDLDYAGMVELVGDRYEVVDWKNEHIESTDSLAAAQLALEPSARAAARALAEKNAERHLWAANTAITLSLVAVAVTAGWIVSGHA